MTTLIAAEFHKIVTTRLWLWLMLAAMSITALYASLNIGFADNTVTYPLSTQQGQQTLIGVAAGAAKPLAAVFGAVGITTEFRHRTATPTFLATPHRGRVVAAKLITYAVAGIGLGMASTVVVVAIAVPWLSARGIDLALTANDLPGTMAGGIVSVAIYAMIGVGLGALLRDQVATVVGLLIYLYVVETVVTQIPALGDWTVYLPGPAGSSLTGLALITREFLPAWQGGLALAGYALAFALAGTFLAVRRDIS